MNKSDLLIPPHGHRLVNRILPAEAAADAIRRAQDYKQIVIDDMAVADLELLANGAYSPLTGFMTRDDYERVIDDMHLDNGLPWTIPITLTVTEEAAHGIRSDETVCLADGNSHPLALMIVNDKFRYSKEREAACVYGTEDPDHPGVKALYRRGPVALGGPIQLIRLPSIPLRQFCLSPTQVRKRIKERGWRTVVGFQTRNPLHRAHEYLQKCALEMIDGLLVHPLVGPTKDDDVPAEVRLQTYQVMLDKYYPQDRVLLSGLPAAMRYAGPREAVFHALVRKNYGCTHFIVGRNHAGVGNYYGPYDAQLLFDRFDPAALGITPVFFEHAFYCRVCGGMATSKTCPHPAADHVVLSGTEVRRRLAINAPIEPEFSRPEVVEILRAYARSNNGRYGEKTNNS